MSAAFIDIETRRSSNQDILERAASGVKPPGSYKKPESIAEWWKNEGAVARLKAMNETALDGTWGQLATISLAVGDDDIITISGESQTEQSMLVTLKEWLAKYKGQTGMWVAFNGDFDFRFLYQRFIINGVARPFLPLSKGDYYFDPMKEWAGYRGYIKQHDLELALGIQRVDPLKNGGADVAEALDAGDWAAVVAHNREDIRCLREIFKRMVQT